jgi:hypothetical protein
LAFDDPFESEHTTAMQSPRWLPLGLTLVAACADPYRPACRANAPTRLTLQSGVLTEHAQGHWQFATLSTVGTDGGAFTERVTVSSFAVSGEPLDERTLTVEPSRGPVVVAGLTEGVAIVSTRSSTDGGRELEIGLYGFDGGVGRLTVPSGALGGFGSPIPRLAEVGPFVHLSQLGVDGPELLQVSRDATLVGRRAIERGEPVVFGSDATAIGRTLVSPTLEPLTSRGPALALDEVVAWSVSARRWVVANLVSASILVDQFDFEADEGAARRVSEGTRVVGVGVSSSGAGVTFEVTTFVGEKARNSLWFAAVDETGRKRGPDVPIGVEGMPGLAAPARVAPLDASGFGLFFPTIDGLIHQRVTCE